MDELTRFTIEIGNKLMREGEIFFTQDINNTTRVRLIRYINEIYKITMKNGSIFMIEHWGSSGWFIWKEVK